MFLHSQLFLVLAFSAYSGAEFLEKFLSQHRGLEKERELFLFDSTGELGSRCGRSNPCNQGLECVTTVGRKACYPQSCAEQAFQLELVQKQNLADYKTLIMQKAGLREDEDLFNYTTVARGEDALDAEGLEYILNGNARNSIIQAMRSNPLDMGPYLKALENCTKSSDGKAPTVSGVAGLGGFMFKCAAGFKFQNTFYFVQGNNDTTGSVYTDICLGGGPDVAVIAGGMGGVAFTGRKNDLLACSVQYDLGAYPGAGVGFGNGYTIPGCVGQLEFYLAAGVGGGGGLSGCFTCASSNYDEE